MTIDIPAKLAERVNFVAEHWNEPPELAALILISSGLNAYDAERLTSRSPAAACSPIGPEFRPGEIAHVTAMVKDGIQAATGDADAQARMQERLEADLS